MTNQYPTPDLLYRALGATLRIAEAFPADALSTPPATGMMTAGEIIDHIASDLEHVLTPIADWLKIPIETSEEHDPRKRLARANDSVRTVLNSVRESQWLMEMSYPGGHTMSVVRAALVMLEHDAHHRGELIVALRSMGIEPPKRWLD